MPILIPTQISLGLEDCDAKALANLMAERHGQPLDVDGAHELLGTLIELRDAEAGVLPAADQDGLQFRGRAIGGAILWSPTLAARMALRRLDTWRIPADWQPYASEWLISCAGWVLAHGRDADGLALFTEPAAQRLVEGWIASLTCTSAELSEVVSELLVWGYPPVDPGAASRKKALADRTKPRSWSAWLKLWPAARRITGCTRFPKRICTGCAARLHSALASWRRRRTPRSSALTIHASTPANAGSAPGPGWPIAD